jgi:hypothetical protein
MLLLATTSSKLQVVTGSAVANTVMHASWVDNNNSAITPGALHATTASAVTTDLVAAPGASTQRNVGMSVLQVLNTRTLLIAMLLRTRQTSPNYRNAHV